MEENIGKQIQEELLQFVLLLLYRVGFCFFFLFFVQNKGERKLYFNITVVFGFVIVVVRFFLWVNLQDFFFVFFLFFSFTMSFRWNVVFVLPKINLTQTHTHIHIYGKKLKEIPENIKMKLGKKEGHKSHTLTQLVLC